MLAAEEIAREESRTLLVLDTAGDEAERLYKALDQTAACKVPDYARSTTGMLEATTIMW